VRGRWRKYDTLLLLRLSFARRMTRCRTHNNRITSGRSNALGRSPGFRKSAVGRVSSQRAHSSSEKEAITAPTSGVSGSMAPPCQPGG
jgi:hypothetical protein